jgi:hypothetical protein
MRGVLYPLIRQREGWPVGLTVHRLTESRSETSPQSWQACGAAIRGCSTSGLHRATTRFPFRPPSIQKPPSTGSDSLSFFAVNIAYQSIQSTALHSSFESSSNSLPRPRLLYAGRLQCFPALVDPCPATRWPPSTTPPSIPPSSTQHPCANPHHGTRPLRRPQHTRTTLCSICQTSSSLTSLDSSLPCPSLTCPFAAPFHRPLHLQPKKSRVFDLHYRCRSTVPQLLTACGDDGREGSAGLQPFNKSTVLSIFALSRQPGLASTSSCCQLGASNV